MKILITDSEGMLGTDLIKELTKQKIEFLAIDAEEFDITKKETNNSKAVDATESKDSEAQKKNLSDASKEKPLNVPKKILDFKPSHIINCAEYTHVDKAEKEDKDLCKKINVEGVENLVRLAKELKISLVQISSDQVFDGENQSYDEDSKKHPINYYGYTKAKAEDIITGGMNYYYIIRTSWLVGKNGRNFVETMKKLMNEKEEIRVVNDQCGNPTFTSDLSVAIVNILKQPFGKYHLTNTGSVTRYGFALKIKRLINSDCNVVACTKEDYPQAARRLRSGILNNNKRDLLRSWKDALEEYLGVEE